MQESKQPLTPNLPSQGTILRNLRSAQYKLSLKSIPGRITAMAVIPDEEYIVAGIEGQGAIIYKLLPCGSFEAVVQLAHTGANLKKNKLRDNSSPGPSVRDFAVGRHYLCYVREEDSASELCIHKLAEVLAGNVQPHSELQLLRKAPMVLVEDLHMIVLSGAAWTSTWLSNSTGKSATSIGEKPSQTLLESCNLRAVRLSDMQVVKDWRVADNGVGILRQQCTPQHNMVAAADMLAGLKVFDMNLPLIDGYQCLYQVPVEGIRNFELVGDFVGVFHKFEPNVSFWNMTEQKTILCINLQEQMKQLAEEFLEEDDEEDPALYVGDDDDQVTAVVSIRSDDDYVLLYGTKSGCVFGMSVNTRSKLFNIPCPHDQSNEEQPAKSDISGLGFVGEGKIAIGYEKLGLTVLDFCPENPPNRPPTRHQRRSTSTPEEHVQKADK